MDDDIAVNFMRIYQQLLKEIRNTPDEVDINNSLYGYIQMGLPVQRSPGWKWALSREEFNDEFHPNFLSGWAYVTTPNVAKKLVNVSKQVPILWIDDVWVTGILASKAEVLLKSLNMFYTFYKEHIQCCVSEPTLECDFLVGPSENDLAVIRNFGQHSRKCWDNRVWFIKEHKSNRFKSICKARRGKDAILKNCNVPNPYFLPESKGFGEVF